MSTELKHMCVDTLRHNEYYGMQKVFDELYAKSIEQKEITNLMDIVLSRENILLAFRNIKTNTGRNTPGSDNLRITDIAELTAEEVVEKVRYIIRGSKHGYRPKPVRRKEIPKPSGEERPLGIPCIWDRLVQQCIKQVMEPICEARFCDTSYGFRPGKSVENAIARTYQLMQRSNLHYVVEFDIKGFFDNVDHTKLIKQIWALNIHDKELIYVIKKILKAPIQMPDKSIVYPTKGTPQGGIISPLLANIVLNELDHWVESQWRYNPVVYKYAHRTRPSGVVDHSAGYTGMRNTTSLKEMQIVRYADDFRIFCRNRQDAEKVKIAITKWLKDRLKLDISEEKTRIVNARKNYMYFLGFKMKLVLKGQKLVIESHVSEKQLKRETQKLKEQIATLLKAGSPKTQQKELYKYNAMVMGMQNYYRIATKVSWDFRAIGRAVDAVTTNRFRENRYARMKRTGRPLTEIETILYGKSKSIRYLDGEQPVYPISYVQYKSPINAKRKLNFFTEKGRSNMHQSLRINTKLMLELMNTVNSKQSIEYSDNRISLFSAQWGKCAVTGKVFTTTAEIHCHHKIPKELGGTDEYSNLILVHEYVHRLIHAKMPETIQKYLARLNLNEEQLEKVNKFRELAKLERI